MDSIKNVIKDFEHLEKMKKAREEDVQHLEKYIAELKEQNAQLSSQVEKHLEEKSNGNWAKEGAVVWDSEYKFKGVLLKHPNDNELHFVCFVPNSGIEDWPFAENHRNIEPYKGQDKEEVEEDKFKKFLQQIQQGDILIKGQLVVCVLVVYSKYFTFKALTDTCKFEKGENYASEKGNWSKYDANKLKLPF
jgi:hypothetical protein